MTRSIGDHVERSVDQETAAERAQWLAELAEAIDGAKRLARTLAASESADAEAREIFGRLEAVELEVEALRRGSRNNLRRGIDPKWTSLVPWNRRREP